MCPGSVLFFQEADPVCREFFYLFPKAVKLFFVAAELLRAVLAAEVVVGALAEPLRMAEEGELPPDQQGEG